MENLDFLPPSLVFVRETYTPYKTDDITDTDIVEGLT